MFYFFLLILLSLMFNIIILKKNFLLDNLHFSKHKNFTTSDIRIPVSGGFLITIFIIFFNQDYDSLSLFLLCVIFFSGFLSSTNFSIGNTLCNSADDLRFFLRLSFLIDDFLFFIIR